MKKIFTLLATAIVAASFAQAKTVDMQILQYSNNKWNEVGEAIPTEVTIDGSTITLADFLNTNSPVSFTLGTPDEEGEASITPTGDTVLYDEEYEGYYVRTADGSAYANAAFTDLEGNTITIYYPFIDPSYSSAYVTPAADGTNDIELLIDIEGYIDSSYETYKYYYLSLYFNDGTDSISSIEADENAPIEYYNLQGIRVDNPESGVYVRRQGSKVSKVLVR